MEGMPDGTDVMDSGGVNARMHIHTNGWVGSLSLWGHKHMPVTSVS